MNFLLVDDHKVVREGLRSILLDYYPGSTIREASSAEELDTILINSGFDVVISDFSLPGRSGLDVIKQVHSLNPQTPVLILSMHPEEQYALRALKAGASGYINKASGSEELQAAIDMARSGRKYVNPLIAEQLADQLNTKSQASHELLSDREFLIFRLIAEGRSLSSIAAAMKISLSSVSTYRARILKKMQMISNADLTRYAIKNSLLNN